ncbi:DUF397 domain-containing protein [Kitasatospora kifunensis]|uniref:DUF397 domain-containing protein n=1 Tax=Kitasatospora kifunensis TaxID=58351 RepID=A0A7W7R5T1_KITKI|nr:DUF397 domain-containing protein [Kitasatospora kifunensis]MBB4925945.1 hypothetical protein [Kitasatospora kifunensis]
MSIDPTNTRWMKSSYSQSGGNCIEVAPNFPGVVPVRDSKNPEGPALIVPAASWSAFVAGVRAGDFGAV